MHSRREFIALSVYGAAGIALSGMPRDELVLNVLYSGEGRIWLARLEPNFVRAPHGRSYRIRLRNNVPDEFRSAAAGGYVPEELASHCIEIPELGWSTGRVTLDKEESPAAFDANVRPGLYLYRCTGGTNVQHGCMSGFFAVEDETHGYGGKSYRELVEAFAKERGYKLRKQEQ